MAKEATEKLELKAYRRRQYELAYLRDDGKCAICWFKKDVINKAEDVHHVYGRGKTKQSSKEKYTSLLCVCRLCHPQPLLFPTGESEIEQILAMANATPINPAFELADESIE